MITPFNYNLPLSAIASRPVHPADSAKLLRCSISSMLHAKKISDNHFYELPSMLRLEDMLVFNNSAVIKARLFGKIESLSGFSDVEVLLLKEERQGIWLVMGRPLKKFKAGRILVFENDKIKIAAKVIERSGDYQAVLDFSNVSTEDIFKVGVMPIPPYIRGGKGDKKDEDDYQPLLARHYGSVAAPTASLHFNNDLLTKIDAVGIKRLEVTLHVGPASFLNVYDDKQNQVKPPGYETMVVDNQVIKKINEHKNNGGRIVAVGTTVVRFLESIKEDIADYKHSKMNEDGTVNIDTNLFIHPGYKFKIVDAMITNFHQPGSSHLLLVEAFMGKKMLKKCYAHALLNGYRFLSYGDGMFIE